MPNPGDVVTISGCPCCSSSSSSSSSSKSSSSSSDGITCLCGHIATAFQFTISGVAWTTFPSVVHHECDNINATITIPRVVYPNGSGCHWHYRYLTGFGTGCYWDWDLTVSVLTGSTLIWHLAFITVGGTCLSIGTSWDGYCQTTGCQDPVTFTGAQCDFFTCPSCCSGPSYRDPTFTTTITLTVI